MIKVYFKDGRIFEYNVDSCARARAHMAKIWETGYRSISDGSLTWYGPHYIDKIIYLGKDVDSNYSDTVKST